jgi:hypothetical protein
MIEIVSKFVIREAAHGQFELAFGPGGAWGKMFAKCEGFRGLTLMRDTEKAGHYLVVEIWDAVAQREAALAARAAEHAQFETILAGWTESRTEVGVFRLLAEATVRPRGATRQRSPGSARGRNPRTSH